MDFKTFCCHKLPLQHTCQVDFIESMKGNTKELNIFLKILEENSNGSVTNSDVTIRQIQIQLRSTPPDRDPSQIPAPTPLMTILNSFPKPCLTAYVYLTFAFH